MRRSITRLQNMKAETPGDTVPNVEAEASADMRAHRLAEVKAV